MPANNIQQHSFSDQDRLFFDTNVWFFIYGPQTQSNERRQRIYSNAFRDIISHRSRIFIDVLVLAEFVNRMARFYFDLWCEENQLAPEYKEFRSMNEFKPIASEIEQAAQMILVDSTPLESGFSRIDISALLRDFEKGQQDFNDLVIVKICQANHLTLVTDDSDFRSAALQILTSNSRLLNP
jgi:predicted nucleic acid-binding protein